MIDLDEKYLQMVREIVGKMIPSFEVRVFGSRVKGTAKKFSDIDLAVKGKTELSPKQRYELQEAFDASNLPMRVDIVDWNDLEKAFRCEIEKRYEVIQETQ